MVGRLEKGGHHGQSLSVPQALPSGSAREGPTGVKGQFQDPSKRPAVIEATLTTLPNGWVHIDFSRLGLLEPGEDVADQADRQPVTTSLTLGPEHPRVLRLPPVPWAEGHVEEIVVDLRLEQLSTTYQDKSPYEY
jgi:hypothetical protein